MCEESSKIIDVMLEKKMRMEYQIEWFIISISIANNEIDYRNTVGMTKGIKSEIVHV